MDFREQFAVKPGSRLRLDRVDTRFTDAPASKDGVAALTAKNSMRIADQQMRIYAERRYSVLIVLQGLDAAGKDGVVKHVLSAVNPIGCTATSFTVPSAEEASHDFLWRYHKVAPAKGHISIFNRSHYEAVLVERVHKLVPKRVWTRRYQEISDFERLLRRNGTAIVKLYLHMSKEEQLARFKDRLDDRAKRWKISESDYSEREFWDDYLKAYEAALSKTSHKRAPWYIVPADQRHVRNYVASQIIADTLDDLKIASPKPRVDLAEIRRKYHEAQES
jgi:PPK2 family polyphosphate:nucleotide phosphotransferase